ncbi:MAG: hypothetical protein AMJ95_09590 [Omnitrophica WOR_2 bacterium SM23_72]|nr:MAG: hypothetical protein AMJ95_09590 [Omnitrophica WOR_2 bacterium SM23_72]
MNKTFLITAAVCLLFVSFGFAQEITTEKPQTFAVYIDMGARENHYIPSGHMGDYGDIKLNTQSLSEPLSGKTCIEIVYSAEKSQGQGWSGVYWQFPADNWGNKKGGYDLTGMTKLTLWARGKKGGEVIQKFGVGGIGMNKDVPYPDTAVVEVGPIELTDVWKQYTINLAGQDLSYINGGFFWVMDADSNLEGATFYLDEIKFEADPEMKPETKKAEGMPFYVYADRGSIGNHFIPSGWMPATASQDIKFSQSWAEDPYLGDTCIKITYNDNSGTRWAGFYWQQPANNWGTQDAGYDLSKATKLTFWARGDNGGERIEDFKIGGILGEYSDSDAVSIGPVILNKEWTQYTIDLRGKDMTSIIGGFCWATNIDVNPEGATFYLDEIKYE